MQGGDDAKTGNLLLAQPMAQDIMDVASPVSAGGVSIARNTI